MGQDGRRAFARLLGWGAALMLAGYALSCLNPLTQLEGPLSAHDASSLLVEPPFVAPTRPVNLWTMNQRAGSLSYLTFGAGLSLTVYALFVLLCDMKRLELGIFRTLGTNALAGYVIHDLVGDAIKPYAPKDAPLWYVLVMTGLFLSICYLFIRHLENNKLFLRL